MTLKDAAEEERQRLLRKVEREGVEAASRFAGEQEGDNKTEEQEEEEQNEKSHGEGKEVQGEDAPRCAGARVGVARLLSASAPPGVDEGEVGEKEDAEGDLDGVYKRALMPGEFGVF